ncbi:hypothetical protein [Bradyrhizobium sp. LA6.12]|uniref:hypothetical protein n=1 Tax=unclassified Bradyrhizobium TaxID=2631580 RepID=UPI00339B67F6
MSKLEIIITLLAVLYLPVLIGACWISFRIGVIGGKSRGHDEASQLWPQHSDYDDRSR